MNGFREGYHFYSRNIGNKYGMLKGDQYVSNVDEAINEFAKILNKKFSGNNADAEQLKGYIAEYWHAGTHNINIVVKDGSILAKVLEENGFASVDVITSDGLKFGLKFYQEANATLEQQAKSAKVAFREYKNNGGKQSFEEYMKERGITDPDAAIYAEQIRVVPKEEIETIKKLLQAKIAKGEVTSPEQVERYRNTLKMLDDRIRDSEGIESIPLDTKDARELARLAQNGDISEKELNKLGISTNELIGFEDIMSQAFQAGLTAAMISAVFKIAPEIYSAIINLIKNGYIHKEDLHNIGIAAIQGTSDGFIRGSISAALTSAFKSGLCGEALQTLDPTIIGMATSIAIDTLKNACLVARGKISKRELADELIRELFISTCSYAAGTATQMFIEVPVLGFLIGSFVGSVIGSFAYNAGSQVFLSYCIESGFTMFGLVKQNYELPKEVLQHTGIDIFELDTFELDTFELDTFELDTFELDEFIPDSFSIVPLKRGIIGVLEIGYI